MVLAGAMVADSRDTLVPDVPAPARRATQRRPRRTARRRPPRGRRSRPVVTRSAAWRADALRTWRTHLAAVCPTATVPAPTAAALGRIATALDDVAGPRRRAAHACSTAPATCRSGPSGGRLPGDEALAREVADALAAVVSPRDGVPPDAGTLVAAADLLGAGGGACRGARRAPALTLLGLLAWWHGDGARAAVLLERALRADPGHRLAHLLADALGAGLAPGWVRVPR